MLRIPYRVRPRRMARVDGIGGGQEKRIVALQRLVTALFRYERIESVYQHCDETRGYAERLISLAIRNGNKHKDTMKTADFWLLEKDLIPKLFEVLVPRFVDYSSAYTNIYRLPTIYPGTGKELGIIELKGNPWPDVKHKKRDKSNLLTNILLSQVKQDYEEGKVKFGLSGTKNMDGSEASTQDSWDNIQSKTNAQDNGVEMSDCAMDNDLKQINKIKSGEKQGHDQELK